MTRLRSLLRGALPLVALVALVATTAGCGTMLNDKEFAAGEGTQAVASSNGQAATGSNGSAPGATIPGTAGTEGTAGTTGSAGGATGDGGSGGAAGGGGGGSGSGGGAASGPNQASDTGVTASSIKAGNITAVNGALGPDTFSPFMRGSKLYFQAINEQGGINGRKVDFQTCDDAENPNQDKSCARQLIEGSQVFGLVGNATDTYAAASYVSGQGVPDIGGYPIGNAYYKYPTLFAILGSDGYPRDGSQVGNGNTLYIQTGVYRHFRDTVGVSAAGVLYYSIAISQTAGKLFAASLQKEGIPVVYQPGGGAGIVPTQQSYDSDVIAMRNAGVNGIWSTIDIAGFQKLCLAMDRNAFTVKANVTTAQGWGQKVGRDFSSPCRNTVYSTGFSTPYSVTDDPQVARILDAKDRYDPQGLMHQWVVEGWAAGKLFDDAVSSMGAAPTRAGVVQYIDGLRDYTYGGLFSPVDWRTSRDYSQGKLDCYSLVKWDDSAATFVNVLGGEVRHCIPADDYTTYQPVDDGS